MMHGKPQIARFFIVLLFIISGSFLLHAQDATQDSTADSGKKTQDSTTDAGKKKDAASATSDPQGDQDPLARPKPQTPSGKREKLGSVYKKWLDEDVRW